MKKNKKLLLGIGIIALLGIVSVGIYRNRQQGDDGNVVRIGAILPLTGKHADAGNAIRVGLEFARQKLETNSHKYEICYFDTKSDAKNAIMGYNKLKNIENVNMFFTTISENGLALKPAVLRDGGLLFGILSHVDLLSDRDARVFRFLQTGEDEANFMSDYIDKELSAKHIALFIFNAEAGIAFRQTFVKRLGDRIIGIYNYEDNAETVKALIATSNLKDADCAVVVGYSPTMGTVIKQIKQSGFQKTIVANIGFNNPSILAAAGASANDVWFNDYDLPYGTSEHASFTARAEKEFNTPFTSLSYIAYGAMGLIDLAYKNDGGSFEEKVKEALNTNATNVFEGVKFVLHPDGRIITGLKMTTFSK